MSKNILANLALRNQVLLDRYKAAQVVEFDQVHKELEKAISETLAAVEVDTLDQLSKAELTGLLKELQVAQTDIGAAQLGTLTEQLAEFAGFTAKAEALALTGITKAGGKAAVKATAATAKQAYQRALDDPMNVGKEHTGVKMDGFMKGWSSAQTNMVNGAVLNGWQQGKTVQQVMQQIRGTKAANYKDGLTAASRRDAAAMVRTATQHVAQAARMETWARNGDLIEGYEILATLDSRTTQICRSMDGRKFDLGKGPFPPFHVNCRTTTVPTLGSEWDFLDEGATRSSANGYVDANLTYYDWLKQQDPAFVKEALGASRAKLFLDPSMTSQQFSDMNLGKNYEPLTLTEMATNYPTVFKGTGLEKFIPDGAELIGDLGIVAPTPAGKTAESVFASQFAKAKVAEVPFRQPVGHLGVQPKFTGSIEDLKTDNITLAGASGSTHEERLELLHKATGMTPQGLKKQLLGDFDTPSGVSMYVRVEPDASGEGTYINYTLNSWTPNGAVFASRAMQKVGTEQAYVMHNGHKLSGVYQSSGVSKKLARNALPLYDHLGLNFIKLEAGDSVGGYAWARYGFTPTESAWGKFRLELTSKVKSLAAKNKISATPEELKGVYKLLQSKDPKALQVFAALKYDAGDFALGKQVLLGTSWYGSLSLKDATAYSNYRKYITL